MTESQGDSLVGFLEQVTPFRFLSLDEKRALLPHLQRVEFAPGHTVIQQGDTDDRSVYLIVQGEVEVLDRAKAPRPRLQVIEAGHYVGEWEPLFEEPRVYEVRTLSHCVCYVVSGERFMELVRTSRAFAQALGVILRDRQGIFAAFDGFTVELMRSATQGFIPLARIIERYEALQPALHPLVSHSSEIDFEALEYAVRRLPANITRVLALQLTDQHPAGFPRPDAFFPMVETAARRRDIWELLPGKNVVLLRDGASDLFDLVTCICLYSVEARKIRRRLEDPETIERLAARAMNSAKPEDDGHAVPSGLPFSAGEYQRLCAVWRDDTPQRLWEIVRHNEMFSITVQRRKNTYNSLRSELWTAQVGNAARELMGVHPSGFPSDLPVHIISSNTHSVTNCLNPWYGANAMRIVEWAKEHDHPLVNESWHDRSDLVYALAREFFLAHPSEAEEAFNVARENGIVRLRETASTGIQVQLVDTAEVDVAAIDPALRGEAISRSVIVNIDYAFGEQAQHIIRNLLMLFGSNVRSISFLGKAGALCGNRGDLLVPTAFIAQTSDQFEPVPAPTHQRIAELRSRIPERSIHQGPLLTVNGTLLQNRTMLQFYRRIWGCIGLEMEGFHYYRQVVESQQLGVVPDHVALRCAYYVSDLPMDASAGLSARLASVEGVPPLYAITRQILSEIISEQYAPR